jgi:hypothetical protein
VENDAKNEQFQYFEVKSNNFVVKITQKIKLNQNSTKNHFNFFHMGTLPHKLMHTFALMLDIFLND